MHKSIIPKVLFALLVVALLLLPLGLISRISQREMEAYAAPELPELRETAYGDIVETSRTDVAETIAVSGTFVSRTYAYQELGSVDSAGFRWEVSVGDEVHQGDKLGTYKGRDVTAEFDGIIDEINPYASSPYIRYKLFTPVELECTVDESTASVLRRSTLELTLEDGTPVELLFLSRIQNVDGTAVARFHIDSDRYRCGAAVSDLPLRTGRVFSQALVVDADALYQRSGGEEDVWYARQVDSSGAFMQEVSMKVSYRAANLVCISGDGLEEGMHFDKGYKTLIGG